MQPPPLHWDWLTAVLSLRLFTPLTQAVPRGRGGSFDEAYQSILVPTVVSWEGNWSHNGLSHLLKGPEVGTPPSALQEGSWPSSEGKMTVHIREAQFRTFDR